MRALWISKHVGFNAFTKPAHLLEDAARNRCGDRMEAALLKITDLASRIVIPPDDWELAPNGEIEAVTHQTDRCMPILVSSDNIQSTGLPLVVRAHWSCESH